MESRVESNQGDLSDDEAHVLQVQSIQKGEFVSKMAGVNQPSNGFCVRSRLKQLIKLWQKIEAPGFILDTTREGYKIKIEPAFLLVRNNRYAHLHSLFVTEEILDLSKGDRISEVNNRADLHVLNPLSVSVQPPGKKILILDLRSVNECLVKKKFEDHRVPTQVIEWLGISWNAKEGFITINKKQISKTKRLVMILNSSSNEFAEL